MIEKIVISYLTNALGIPVYAEKPTNKPNEYVVIRLIDSGCLNHIYASTFYIEAFSTSMQKASELNMKVRDAMLGDADNYGIIQIDNISACKFGGGGQNIDTATKTYAYESIFNLFYTI